ncbi:uncharacterized protein A4U43_C04F11490 [Asparagus officinalis]|uniref:RNase H type-1 domain-containing protein n=1 Tax=Asparagus officinalis TaxID=4686 RepID=A0A5P1F1W3_ASPOF|nr:uncharacterized protein A4U43_C04F11490 [Asparagus officinalis]
MWALWYNRNHYRVGDSEFTEDAIIFNTQNLVREYLLASKTNIVFAYNFQDIWEPPPMDVLNINNDGTLCEDGKAAVGCVFLDYHGLVQVAYAGRTYNNNSIQWVEAMTILKGMKVPKEIRFQGIMVDINALEIIQELSIHIQCKTLYGAVIDEIKEWSTHFRSCIFKHIRRKVIL